MGLSIAFTHPAGMLATLKDDGLLSKEEFRIISALLQQQRQRHRLEAAAEPVAAPPQKPKKRSAVHPCQTFGSAPVHVACNQHAG